MKRVAIYFFYDGKGIVHDYVPYFLSDLTKNIDRLIIVVNGQMDDVNQAKLAQFGEVYLRDNDELDVGAYKYGLAKNVKSRLWKIPYKVEILETILLSKYDAIWKEYNSLKEVNRYIPQRIFGGYTECFN